MQRDILKIEPQQPHQLAQQCQQALAEVTFPDLETRQLFEALIKNIATK
jgi:hypothetical protein